MNHQYTNNMNWPEKLARALNRLPGQLDSLKGYWANAEELEEELIGDEHQRFNAKEEVTGCLLANLNDMGKEDACRALVDIIYDLSGEYWNSHLGFKVNKMFLANYKKFLEDEK